MKRVLFVDDEAFVLQALQRMLHGMRGEWDMHFVRSAAEALKLFAQAPFDAVISDMRMPDMTGAQLLNQVMQLYPKTVRFILSGYADTPMILECVGSTHQFLSKPCEGETLRTSIRRALAADAWLDNEALKALAARMSALPSLPALYFQILDELQLPDTSPERVGAIIAQDPAMTAKILQMVNSAFFGLRRNLTDPTEAVIQLGLETIKSLVLAIHVFSEFEVIGSRDFSAKGLQRHSFATGFAARRIAQKECLEKRIVDDAFTAGLLHDVGRLVLLANLPDDYSDAISRARQGSIPLADAERAVFGVSHAEVGAYLFGLWGLPHPIVEAAVFHHKPSLSPGRMHGSLVCVHVANVLERALAPPETASLQPELDRQYLTEVGVWERLPAWRTALNENKTGTIA